MKRILLSAAITLFITGITTGAVKEVGEIGSINSAGKEIIVNTKSGIDLKMGDKLEIQSDNGKIILVVIFPMMTTSKCKIQGNGKRSELSKGMTVYRYSKDSVIKDEPAEETDKAGETKIIGNIKMVMLSGGTFEMGSNDGEDDEKPVHKITVDGFWIGKFEVTQKEYEEIMGTNPSKFKDENLPVEQVSWDDAVEFCKKFSAKYNVKARLPYEAEWEYACRGGTNTKYYWGDEIKGDYGWNTNNSDRKTHPVGQKAPNAFGLYDMSGNVWEWCADWYSESYYNNSLLMNPQGMPDGSFRVLRGGSWPYFSNDLRSSDRDRYYPGTRDYNVGFRVVVSR